LVKKLIIVKNATAYTWDWYCHLVVDRPSLTIEWSKLKTFNKGNKYQSGASLINISEFDLA